MYSFYGGKQGRTYNLVERYDLIYIDLTDIKTLDNPNGKLISFISGQLYNFGDYLFYLGNVYLVLYQTEAEENKININTSKIQLVTTDLNNSNYVARIKGMVNEFQKGGAYTDANYGEYVIIDTILNLNHKNDDINGIIYRRGFDYTEPVSSYSRPHKTDKADRSLPIPNSEENLFFLNLNVYHDYELELNSNNEWEPIDKGFNTNRWVAAWRKYILKPGGGAIYVGQIVGPQGDTSEIRGVSWEEFVDINLAAGDEVTHGIVTMTDTLGWDGENYNDSIKTGYCNIKDKDGQVIGAYISFDIPKTVFKISAQSVDAYGDNTRSHYDEASDETDTGISIYEKLEDIEHEQDSPIWKYNNLIHQHSETGVEAGHPFYYNFDIAVPNGIHGQDLVEIKHESGQDIHYILTKDTLIDNNKEYYIYLEEYDVYIRVDSPNIENIENYYELNVDVNGEPIVDNDEYITYYTKHYNNQPEGDLSESLGKWPYRVIKTISTTLKQRQYLDWENNTLASIGDLYIPNNRLNDDIITICVKAGTVGIEEEFNIAFERNQNLGTKITSGTSEWRVVKIPNEPAPASLLINYTAGNNDTLKARFLDYFVTDNLGNLYVSYSDSDLLHYLTTIGSIDSIKIQNEDDINKRQYWAVNYQGANDPVRVSNFLNTILAIDRIGDNIIVLYSDSDYRDNLVNNGQENIDYYYKNYIDINGKDYGYLPWENLGSIGGGIHIQGEYTLADLKGDTSDIDNFTVDLSNGFSEDRAGWIATVKDNNHYYLYAYDYNLDSTHVLHDGTPSRWYIIKDIDVSTINPVFTTRLSSENLDSGLIYQNDMLNENGLWFVVSGGHDEY